MDSLCCRGADTRPGARMVLEGGGGASHNNGASHRGCDGGRRQGTASEGGCDETLRQRQTGVHGR